MDFRHALRVLSRAPAVTLAIVAVLALGIGSNCAIFTALDRMVIRPLPYPHPDQLIMIWEDFSAYGVPKNRVSPGTFRDWKRRATAFEQMGAYAGPRNMDLSEGGHPEELLAQSITANLMSLLGVPPLLGRAFTVEEERPESRVVVLSYRLWQRRFGGDPAMVGAHIAMNGETYTVVGVMPAGFQFPDSSTQLWLPLGLTPELLARRNSHFLRVVGRLAPAHALGHARSEMNRVAGALQREFPNTNRDVGITVTRLKDELLGDTRSAFLILLAATACVLLIVCANVANLLLARAAHRQREMAIRTALGAGRLRLLRQIVVENLIMAGAGGALGLLFAHWQLRLLDRMIPAALAGSVVLAIDWRVVAFTAALSSLTCLLFGLAPALQLARVNLSARAAVSHSSPRLRDALVIAEIAIALVLVIGATLMIETMGRLRAVAPGFRSDHILTADIAVGAVKYRDAATRQAFYNEILARVSAIPGVKSVGLTSDLPYTSRGNTMSVKLESQLANTGLAEDALFRLVSTNYLQTIGAALKEGRWFDQRDQRDSPPAVIVTESLAQRYWPHGRALGQRLDAGTGLGVTRWMTIVGVVSDIRERGLDLPLKPAVYVPFTQTEMGFFVPSEIAILTSRAPLALSKELQQAVWSVDPQQPVSNIRTMDAIVDSELASRTQVLQLLGAFAALALLLGCIGIYGVLSYVVSLRKREIGLRMAVGASPSDVAREVLAYAARLTGVGLAAGIVGGFGLTRFLASFLFGVSALDTRTFVAMSGVLAIVALTAALVPARRAAAIDPISALRDD